METRQPWAPNIIVQMSKAAKTKKKRASSSGGAPAEAEALLARSDTNSAGALTVMESWERRLDAQVRRQGGQSALPSPQARPDLSDTDSDDVVVEAGHGGGCGGGGEFFNEIWPRLLPFQRQGVAFGVAKGGRILIADEMGLGKTLQAIAIAAFYRHDWPVLIVVPASVKYNWAAELEKWIPVLPTKRIAVIRGRTDTEPLREGKADVIIMTYALFTAGSLVAEEVSRLEPPVVVLDESHYIKNHKAQRTEFLAGIASRSRR